MEFKNAIRSGQNFHPKCSFFVPKNVQNFKKNLSFNTLAF